MEWIIARTKQIKKLSYDLPRSLCSCTVFMVTRKANEEGNLYLNFFQCLVLCTGTSRFLPAGFSKAFSNGLFLQKKEKKEVNRNIYNCFQ